jgi:hypothetical protein
MKKACSIKEFKIFEIKKELFIYVGKYEEFNCIEYSPSVSIPWTNIDANMTKK